MMRKSAAQLTHMACVGITSPLVGDGACWLCGGPAVGGRPWRPWVGKGFTSWSSAAAPDAEYVCEACVYVCSRTSPVPGRPPKPDKRFGGNFRNYSHFGDAGDYGNASKGEKGLIRAFLARPKSGPWFCSVADSGQKHVLPFAPVNATGDLIGLVRFEEETICVPADNHRLVALLCDLLADGAVTKAEILTGDYSARAWSARGPQQLRADEEILSPLRGGGWFRLALWLSQRDEAQNTARQAREKEKKDERARNDKRRGSHGRVPRRGSTRSSARGRLAAQTVRHALESDAVGSSSDCDRARVDERGTARATDREPEQMDLFGSS